MFVKTVYLRRITLGMLACAMSGAFAAPASADAAPQRLTLDYSKGKCAQTTLTARSFTPTTLEVTTSNNFTDDAKIDMNGQRVALPDTYAAQTTKIDLGTPMPGAIPFKVSGSDWPGSAGTGCEGWIIIA
ncbi:hypothetical protein GCM10010198_38870 [Nocardia seriolae]|nr:hypothetical protein NSERKGN1266_66040 [Nocardia seriolae]BEK93625.1 hypothetical protein NSER024013_15310 [Nocardia seriolae]GEM27846.1 hypothetical protein NS2_60850 [Nocardia seriolae NBRC 15557]